MAAVLLRCTIYPCIQLLVIKFLRDPQEERFKRLKEKVVSNSELSTCLYGSWLSEIPAHS